MHPEAGEVQQISLMVLRLMDADLLLPEEGRALLTEIEAFEENAVIGAEETTLASRERLLPMLQSLALTGRLDATTGALVREIARQILREANDPC